MENRTRGAVLWRTRTPQTARMAFAASLTLLLGACGGGGGNGTEPECEIDIDCLFQGVGLVCDDGLCVPASTGDTGDVGDTGSDPDTVEDTGSPEDTDTGETTDTSDTSSPDVPDGDVTDTDVTDPDVPDTGDTNVPDTVEDTTVEDTDPDTNEDVWTPPESVNTPWVAYQTDGPLPLIVLMRLDGSGREVIDSGDIIAYDPAWSPDGRRLAIRVTTSVGEGATVRQIRLLDVTAGTSETINPNLSSVASPAWSPDGTAIAFEARAEDDGASDIYTYNLETHEVTRITATAVSESAPAWPRPDTICYLVTNRSTTPALQNYYCRNLATNTETQLTFLTATTGQVTGRPAISWDLRWLLYTREVTSSQQLFLRDTTTSAQVEIGTPNAGGPAFSPDGTWYAYVDAPEGTPQIFFRVLGVEMDPIAVSNNLDAPKVRIAIGPVEASDIDLNLNFTGDDD